MNRKRFRSEQIAKILRAVERPVGKVGTMADGYPYAHVPLASARLATISKSVKNP